MKNQIENQLKEFIDLCSQAIEAIDKILEHPESGHALAVGDTSIIGSAYGILKRARKNTNRFLGQINKKG